jgi:hypothetical protein
VPFGKTALLAVFALVPEKNKWIATEKEESKILAKPNYSNKMV